MTKHQIAFLIALAVLLGVYLVWLDSGCQLSGAMTWHGKVCVD